MVLILNKKPPQKSQVLTNTNTHENDNLFAPIWYNWCVYKRSLYGQMECLKPGARSL